MKRILLSIMTISSLSAFGQSWNLNGNAGTTPGTQFIGTTDAKDLVFKTNNQEKLRITTDSRLVFGGNGMDILLGYGGIDSNTPYSLDNIGIGNLALNMGPRTNNISGRGDSNVAIGTSSLSKNTGYQNTAIGTRTLKNLSAPQSSGNIAIGYSPLPSLTSGSNNIAIGSISGLNIDSGDRNILIGAVAKVPFPINRTASYQLNIGDWIVGNNGVIGIGKFAKALPSTVDANNKFRLFVKDGIRAELVQVDVASTNNWADYVFEEDYSLMPLLEVEKFVQKNKHLPNIPSAEEVVKEGINLAEMNAKLLEKIEELTLYTIEQEKRIQALEAKSDN